MIKRLGLVVSYGITILYQKGIGASQKILDTLYQAVSELGGIYVKLIQFICLRTDIFAEQDKIRFLSFYDTVTTEQLDVWEILTKELGKDVKNQFAALEIQPFASGTFGQVYRGKLVDGTDIVVKILRPGLKVKLAFDFLIMKIAALIFTLFYEQHLINVKDLLNEFKAFTYKELDYQEEAANAQYFYNLYRNHPYVVIPKTFLHLTTKTVLVQEYVGGIPVTEILKNRGVYSGNFKPVINRLAYELGIQGFTGSLFYADPHPGNIKIIPGDKFAFIDFGIVGVSPKNRRTYYNIVKEVMQSADTLNTKRIGENFLEWGAGGLSTYLSVLDAYFQGRNGKLRDLVIDKYSSLLENYRERFRIIEAVEEENFVKMYIDIIRAGELLGVKIPKGMLATMRTVAIFKSWVTYLDPEYHMMKDVYKEILSAVNQKYLINEDDLSPKRVGMEEAIENVLEWVTRIAEKDFAWYNAVRSSFGRLYA